MKIKKVLLNKIISHCKKEYPKEACGILAGKQITNYELRITKIYKMTNVSETPELCYFMNPKEQFNVMKKMRTSGLEMVAVYHSHTHSEPYPSTKDVEMAYYPEIVYIIVSLKNFNAPIIKGYRIVKSKIKEVAIW